MEYSKEDLMEAKKQIWGVGENMGTEEMETTEKELDTVFDKESPVNQKLESLQNLFPEFFFDGKFRPREFELFVDSIPKDNLDHVGYGLNWDGRTDAIRILRKQSEGALIPNRDKSLDFDNAKDVVITGENLEVMKLIQKSYFGSFKMIYMDPPYNTGDDFIYDDDLENNTAHYLDCIKNNEFEVSSKGKISAKLTIDVKESSGTKRKTITIRKNGSDLYNLSGGRDQYKGYVINEIDAGNGYPFFEKKQPTS